MGDGWTPMDLVVQGAFANHEDLAAAANELQQLTSSPVVVATFSGGHLVRSLSLARSDDPDWDRAVISSLQDELYTNLKTAAEKLVYVAGLIESALERRGCPRPATLSFGGDLHRPGRLAVVVGAQDLAGDATKLAAETLAAMALGSRSAAVSLDTSLELAMLSELRQAAERARFSGPSPASAAGSAAMNALLRFASAILDTTAIVAYEASSDSPHRFEHLDRRAWVLPNSEDPPSWMPSRVALTHDLPIPGPPELGGSRFDALDELVDHCFLSKDRPRRLVAEIAGRFRAYGIPYGFDDVRKRPIGVLCLVWAQDARELGSYELSAARAIALHLARGYDTRHTNDTVRLVTSQLSFISDMPSDPDAGYPPHCDDILRAREDVRLITPTVTQIVRGLVNLSGAMSVTCRLISGASGAHLTRYLVRLHCEGDRCASSSPNKIPLDDAESSVNAWVARTGENVYLRELFPTGEHGSYTSPDLESYEGLDRVRIYRDGVECELCVPIFAERRLVGTVNLEADRKNAFDASWETVAEYAQLIGIALLESRRKISVNTVTEVGGFLDYRHRLDAELREFTATVNSDEDLAQELRARYATDLDDIREVIFMRRIPDLATFGPDTRISDIIASAMRSVGWGNLRKPIQSLTLGPWSSATQVYSAFVEKDAARALTFAIAQALHNIRKHGGTGDALARRPFRAMYRFGEARLGGRRSLYVAVSSTCPPEKFDTLDPQCVFRQPIEGSERVSLGAFLVGEALRRCGGSAYLRVTHSPHHDSIVDAEFSVPAAQ